MRRIPQALIHPPILAVADAAFVQAGLLTVVLMQSYVAGLVPAVSPEFKHTLPYTSIIAIVALYACNLYTHWVRRKSEVIAFFIGMSSVMISLSTTVLAWWEGQLISIRCVAAAAVLQCILLILFRLWLRDWYLSSVGRRRTLLVAPDGVTASRLTGNIVGANLAWLDLAGYVLSSDFRVDSTQDCDTVLLCQGLEQENAILEACALTGKHVMLVPAVTELPLLGAEPVEVDDLLLFSLHSPALTPGAAVLKRLLDLVISATLLVLLSPVMLVVAVLVRLTSAGPAIFQQLRVGKNGAEFTLYKFRTMTVNAEEATGPVLARAEDSRVTSLGARLRETRLDELPQLVNVFLGHMSLVGPRPERLFFVEQFRETVAGYDLRHAVRPGITGLAQVAGSYSTTVERKLRYDLLYVYNCSLLLDVRILFRTLLVVFHKVQAAGVSLDGLTASAAVAASREAE